MKSTDGPAGDRNEDEWINLARYHRTAAGHEWCHGRHLQVWVNQDYSNDQEGDRESSPWRFSQSVNHHQTQPGQGDDHDKKNRDSRDQPRQRTDFSPRDLSQRFSFAPDARGENHEVVHRTTQADSDNQPQQSRQESELRRQHWTNQRPGAGDSREVMTEQNPLVGWIIIVAVIHSCRRYRPRVIERQHFRCYESRIVAISDRQDAERADNNG